MTEPAFFRTQRPVTVAALASFTGAEPHSHADRSVALCGVAQLDRATRHDVAFFDGGIDVDHLRSTRAGACFLQARHLPAVPPRTVPLLVDQPSVAFAKVLAVMHPASGRPTSIFGSIGVDRSARVHATATLEGDVTIDPAAVIGPEVAIGAGTFIGAFSVIGAGVCIGRGCAIDAQTYLGFALVGDRVLIQGGARIGLARSSGGLGRVIIQNDAVIGANAVIERSAMHDTIIGEGGEVGALSIVPGGSLVDRHGRFA